MNYKVWLKILALLTTVFLSVYLLLDIKNELLNKGNLKIKTTYINENHLNMELSSIERILTQTVKECQEYESPLYVFLKNKKTTEKLETKIKQIEIYADENKIKISNKIKKDLDSNLELLKQEMKNLELQILDKISTYIIITIIFVIIYLLYIVLNFSFFGKEESIEHIEEEDKEAYNKQRFKSFMIGVFIAFTLVYFIIDNVTYLMTTLSIITILLALGIRDLLSDILSGVMLRFKLLTFDEHDVIKYELKQGQELYVRIKKIGLLKSVIHHMESGIIYSIRNISLIQKSLQISPMEQLKYIEMTYRLPFNKDLKDLETKITNGVIDEIRENEDFKFNAKEFRTAFPKIRTDYSYVPKIKPKMLFVYSNDSAGVISMEVRFNLWSTISQNETISHFFKIIKDIIEKECPELGQIENSIISMR